MTDAEVLTFKPAYHKAVPVTKKSEFVMGCDLGQAVDYTVLALVHWRKWGKKRLDPKWYETLAKTGGHKDKTWFIYFGRIPPDWFVAIDDLEPE